MAQEEQQKRIVYKLTDQEGYTRRDQPNETKWGENVTHTARGNITQDLCSDAWIHYYEHPLIAIVRNPQDADIPNPLLWEASPGGEEKVKPLKSGSRSLTTIRQISFEHITKVNVVAFGILCAKEVCKDPSWNLWADRWLSGEDRTKAAAVAVARYADAAYAVARYADAAYAAYAAADAAAALEHKDLLALANKAMGVK